MKPPRRKSKPTPNDQHSLIAQGFRDFKEKRYSAAAEKFDQAEAIDMIIDPAALGPWGLSLQNLAHFDRAIDIFRRAEKLDAKNSLYSICIMECKLEKYLKDNANPATSDSNAKPTDELEAGAKEIEKLAVQTTRNHSKCHRATLSAGMALMKIEQFAISEIAFSRTVELDPTSIPAHFQLGLARENLDKFSEAIDAYSRCIELQPDHFLALHNLAVCRGRVGNNQASINGFLKALSTAQDDSQQQNSNVSTQQLAEAWYNLAFVQRLEGQVSECISSLEKTVELFPLHQKGQELLARVCNESGNGDLARTKLLAWMEADADNPVAKHMLAAIDGTNSTRASADYVESVFDDFANSFESVLNNLDYQVPSIIQTKLSSLGLESDLVVLDAGCGTGLCGPILKPIAKTLVGVDLSSKMLARAKQAGCFTETVHSDLIDYFAERNSHVFDLIVSADTLNYLGDLKPFFEAANASMASEGFLVFTLEESETEVDLKTGFQLQPHGRFAHDLNYVSSALEECGFAVSVDNVVLRKENLKPVNGLLFTAKKN